MNREISVVWSRSIASIVVSATLLLAGCVQPKDSHIKQMIIAGTKGEVAFAGVNYLVKDGVVTLTGNCPTEEQVKKVEERIKQTSGVKNVVNNIQVASVTLDQDFTLKQSVDSVLMKHAQIMASVEDSVVMLQGEASSKELQSLKESLVKLSPKRVDMQVTVK